MPRRPMTASRSMQRSEHRWPSSAALVAVEEPAVERSRQFEEAVPVAVVELQVEEPVPLELRVQGPVPVELPQQREALLQVVVL